MSMKCNQISNKRGRNPMMRGRSGRTYKNQAARKARRLWNQFQIINPRGTKGWSD